VRAESILAGPIVKAVSSVVNLARVKYLNLSAIRGFRSGWLESIQFAAARSIAHEHRLRKISSKWA
jgi:hypothetical protein